MAELTYVKLSDQEIQQLLTGLDGWTVQNDLLTKTFRFDRYLDGAEFAGAVAREADEIDHHPDIYLGYQEVRVSMNTHAVQGLSPYDFELARRIDLI